MGGMACIQTWRIEVEFHGSLHININSNNFGNKAALCKLISGATPLALFHSAKARAMSWPWPARSLQATRRYCFP